MVQCKIMETNAINVHPFKWTDGMGYVFKECFDSMP